MSRSVFTALTVAAIAGLVSLSLADTAAHAQFGTGGATAKEPEPTLAPPRAGSILNNSSSGKSDSGSGQAFNPFGRSGDSSVERGTKSVARVAAAPKKNSNGPPTKAAAPFSRKATVAPRENTITPEPTPAAIEEAPAAAPPSLSPQPAVTQPTVAQPTVAQPAVTQPTITQPAVTLPVSHANRVVLTRRAPQITVEASGPKRITIGKEQTYMIAVRNPSDDLAENVLIFVGLPDWIEIRDAQSSDGSAAPATDPGQEGVQWRLERLAARANQTLSLRVVARKSQPFDLALQWSCSPTIAEAQIEVEEPKLQLAITGPSEVNYGQQQSYKLTLSNPGNGAAENVTIFLLPLTPRDGQAASQNLGTLAAGATKSLEIELVPRQNGEVVIAAEATADGDLKTATQHPVRVRRGDLKLALNGPKTTLAGVPVQFEVRVSNTGDAAARRTQVTTQLPSGAEVISISQQGQHQAARSEIVWLLDQVAAGSEQVLYVKCLMRQGGTQRIASSAVADGDLHAGVEAVLNVNAFADLHLEVNDTPGPIALGQTVTYEVKIRNRGSGSAEGLEVLAFFSEGIEPLQVEGAGHDLGPGTVTIKSNKSLAPGAEMVYRIRAKASTAGQHKIRVELLCQSLGTKLTQEDTTLFYADEALSGSTTDSTATRQGTPAAPQPR